MRIAILPDLHITSEGKLSPFYLNDDEFFTVLSQLSEEVDKIYCVGDTFDLWRAKGLSDKSQKKELNKIRRTYSKTTDFFLSHPKFGGIAVGNHDDYLLRVSERSDWKSVIHKEIILTNSKKQKIVLRHGQLDIFNRVFPWVGQMVTWGSAWLERIFIRN